MTKSKSKSKKVSKSPATKDDSESDSSKVGSVPESPVSVAPPMVITSTPPTPSSVTSTPVTTPTALTLATPLTPLLQHVSPHVVRPSPTAWFTSEIQHMMYGFGDCRRPLVDSASIIEEVVHEQLTTLLYQAAEVASSRSARFLSIEDFLFLLRKDKNKLRRLIRYMTLKDLKAAALKGASEDEEQSETGECKQPKKKRKICYDFLKTIDQTGELLVLFEDDSMDEVKHERALRAELMSRSMSAQQYLEFSEARQSSFAPRFKSQKFRDWLMTGVSVEPKPNPVAIEVLVYLAYETVAQIVDLSLLVRRDMRAQTDDPFQQSMPSLCINHELTSVPPPPSLQSATPGTPSTPATPAADMKSPNRVPSPVTSPPSTPTTPSSMLTPGGGGSSTPGTPIVPTPGGTSGSNSSVMSVAALKAKAKKRKKSGSQTSRELATSQALQPMHIREALRRFHQSTGPIATFSKSPLIPCKRKLLCL